MSWSSGIDNVGVTGYRIYRNGELTAENITNCSYTGEGLQSEKQYTYIITAVDAAGNESAESEPFMIETSLPVIEKIIPEDGSVIGKSQEWITISFPVDRLAGSRKIEAAYYDAQADTWESLYTDTLAAKSNTSKSFYFDTTPFTEDQDIRMRFVITDEDGYQAEKGVTYHIDRTGPEIPDDFSANEANARITLTWSGSEDKDCKAYHLYRKVVKNDGNDDEEAEYKLLSDRDIWWYNSSYRYTDTDILQDMYTGYTYSYYLETEDTFGNRAQSQPIDVFVGADQMPPSAPTFLYVERRTGSAITVSWSGAKDNVGVTAYNVYRNGERIAENITSTYYKDCGDDLPDGLRLYVPYLYTVTALDKAGNESAKSMQVLAETSMPSVTSVTPADGSVIGLFQEGITITLANDALAGNRYIYAYHYNEYDDTWEMFYGTAIMPADRSHQIVSEEITFHPGLYVRDKDIRLRFVVRDVDGNQIEKDITYHLDDTGPRIPDDFSATEKDAKVTLTWSKSEDDDCKAYYIYRKVIEDNDTSAEYELLTRIIETGRASYSYVDTDVQQQGTYSYYLKTEDKLGNTEQSQPIDVFVELDTTPPTPPTAVSVRRRTGSSITIEWSGATDNVGVTGYHVYRDGVRIADNITGREYKDDGADLSDGLRVNAPYLYTVTALDKAGNESQVSPQTEGALFMPKITQMTPKDQSLIDGSELSLCVYFTDSGNSILNTAYFQWYDTQSGIWKDIAEDGCAQTNGGYRLLKAGCSWTPPVSTGENEDIPIDIRAIVVDADGNRDEMTITLILDNTPPMPPASVTAEENSGVITLSFIPGSSADTEGYYVYRKEEAEKNYTQMAAIKGRMGNWYSDNTVEAGKGYQYRISAYDAFGHEGQMSEATDMLYASRDTEAPKIRSMEPQSGRVRGSVSVRVEGSDNIGIEKLTFYIRKNEEDEWDYLTEETAADNKAELIWDTSGYADGEYYIKAVAKDAAGNENENLYQRRYEADNTGPGKIILGDCSAGATSLRLEWQDVTEDDFAYFAVEEKRESAEKGISWADIRHVTDKLGVNITGRSPQQSYTLRVVGYDTLGNRGIESDEVTLTTSEDTTGPVIRKINPVSSYYGDSLLLSMTVTDNAGVSEGIFSCSTDGETYTELKRVSASGSGQQETLSYTWDTSAFAEGKIWVRFEAVDTAGLYNVLPSGEDIVNTYVIDHTAPAVVEGLSVTETGGCIGLEWAENKSETDIKAYRIYRSTGENGVYTCIRETAARNYYDTNIRMGTTYLYKISCVDIAGNESPLSAAVRADAEPDTTDPVILSVTPEAGTLLGRNAMVSVLATDNRSLSSIRIEYREKGSRDIWREITEEEVAGRQKYVHPEWDASGMKENTEYELRAVAADSAGNTSDPYVTSYTFDLTPPAPVHLAAETGSYRIELSVSSPKEEDFDHYEIYRRVFGQTKFTYIQSMEQQAYTDTTVKPDTIYYYKILTYDKTGNVSESNTVYSHASSVDTIAPVASLPETIMAVTGMSMRFDGTQSSDNLRVQSYEWNFGDGTKRTGSRPAHTYKEAGTYIVILTVTDAAGNSDTTTSTVIVLDGEENGQSLVRVIDTSGNPIAGADIYVRAGNDAEDVIRTRTNEAGEVPVCQKAGVYEMAAYAQGFMPKDEQIRISNYEKLTKEIVLASGEVVTGELTARRMTLEELVERGIDLSDPQNYNTYVFRVELTFEERPLPVVYESAGFPLLVKSTHKSPGGSGQAYVFTAGGGAGDYVQAVCEETESGEMVPKMLVHLSTTQSVSWLKDMYNVELEIINHADSGFSVEQASATLSLPDGLSLAQEKSGGTLTKNMDTIEGQSRKKVSWVVRGDKNGSYPLSASFHGLLMPFEAPIDMTFETTQDIEVTGGEGLHILIEPENAAYYSENYYIQFTLSNCSDRTFYNLTTSFGDYERPAEKHEVIIKDPVTGMVTGRNTSLTGKTYRSAGAARCKSIPLLFEGDRINVGVFEPGESIRGTYRCTFAGDADNRYLALVESFVRQLEGENLGVTVEIRPIPSHVSKYIYMGLRPGESAEDTIEYGDPVDVASGAFTQQINALQTGGSLSLGLSYNSMLADVRGEAGNGFSHSYESFVKDLGGVIELHPTPASQIDYISEEYEQGAVFGYSAGEQIVIGEDASYLGTYRPVGDTMQGTSMEKIEDAEGRRYELTDTDGTVTTFDAEGRLTSRRQKGKGKEEIFIQRDADTAQVTDTATGECITLSYTDGLLTQASDNHGRSVGFAYDEEGNLTAFTDALGQKSSFTYDKEHRILAAYNPAGIQLCENTYDSEGRVLTQKEAGSEQSSAFSYKDTEDGGMQTVITKRDGSSLCYETDATGNIIKNTDERGYTTEFIYDKKGQLLDEIAPDGSTTMYEYDTAGRLKAVYDTAGNVTSYTYDVDGNPVRIQGNEGEASLFTYNTDGDPVSYISPLGARTTYTYDDDGKLLAESIEGLGTRTFAYRNGRLTKSTDFSGNETVLTYDACGNVGSTEDALGNMEKTTYDALGRIKNSTDALGNVTTYGYDKSGNQTSMTTGDRTVTYEYDDAGRMTAVKDPEGNKTAYAYDTEGNLLKITYPDKTSVSYEYDRTGNVIKETAADGMEHTYVYDEMNYLTEETYAGLTTTYTYYPNGKLRTITNPDGTSHTYTYDRYWNMISDMDQDKHTTSYTYDATGNCLSVTDALGNTASYEYDVHGRLIKETDARGNVTEYQYDANGRCVQETNAEGTVTTMDYDALGQLKSVSVLTHDKDGKEVPVTVSYTYDALGRVIETTDAEGNKGTVRYDGFGNITQVTDGYGNVTAINSYDSLNRLTDTKDSLGNTMSYAYDEVGNMMYSITKTGAGEQVSQTGYNYDKTGRLLSTTDAMNGTTSAAYNSKGLLKTVTDAMDGVTSYDYNELNRLIAVTTAIGTKEEYTYNAEGLLETVENARSQQTTYKYDALGRITSQTDSEGTIRYTYDENGNVLTVSEKQGLATKTITRTYDKLNRVKTYTDYNGNTVEYGYDELGNRISLTYPGGEIVRYTYNNNGQMTSVTGVDGAVTYYTYDKNGRISQQKRPDGSTETYTYDTQGQLTRQEDASADGTILHDLTYIYDVKGNIIKTTGADAGDTSLLTTATMTYDADNRLVTYNGKTVEYDADGNMTYGPMGGEMAHFTYDCRNRLTKVTTETGETTTYTYDAENNRIEQISGDTKTIYVNDPEAVYSQLLQKTEYTKNFLGLYTNKSGETLYTYGVGLTSETGEDGTCYYHFNNIGSTTEITDTAGAVRYRITYGPYGELTGIKDGNQNTINIADEDITPFLYNGQLGVQTDKNGLYYMRARYYNTDIKRFINRDVVAGTIANGQSLNRYSYVQGNPVSLTDPFGLYPIGEALSIISQAGHMLLDVAGIFFDGADLLNAYWYAEEGNTLMAMTCGVAAIPLLGSVAAGATEFVFLGSKAYKTACKAAGYISDLSKLVGYTGQFTISAINTGYAYQDYKRAKANGTATGADALNVAVSALFTVGTGICALSVAGKVTAKLKADGVGDAVKAAAKVFHSNNKGYVSMELMFGNGKSKGGKNTVNWTNHGYKHFPNKKTTWEKNVKLTKNGPAKYSFDIKDIEMFERDAWNTGTKVTNGKNWKVKAYDNIIGATEGKETRYIRVENSANTIHGHPITEEEYYKLIR